MILSMTSHLMGKKWMFLIWMSLKYSWNAIWFVKTLKYKKDWPNCFLQHLVLRNQVFHFLWNMTKILIVLLCTTILATSSVKSSIHKYEAVVAVRKQPKNTRELTHFIVNQWRKNEKNQVSGKKKKTIFIFIFAILIAYALLICFKLCFHENNESKNRENKIASFSRILCQKIFSRKKNHEIKTASFLRKNNNSKKSWEQNRFIFTKKNGKKYLVEKIVKT